MADPVQGATPVRSMRAAALIGTSSEWYDFFLYATAAVVVFPTTFFSRSLDPFVALLASFSTFATALLVMGSATTLIGLLPTYETAGIAAPLALVLLRLVQGFAVGG